MVNTNATQIDVLERYLFDKKDLRASFVTLTQTLHDNHAHQAYSEDLQNLLAEFMLACALLSSSLKFEGRLVLQLRSQSKVPVIMAECNDLGHLRAYAKTETNLKNPYEQLPFAEFKNGTLALTLQPKMGEAYQGIVPLDGNNLAECLQHYFVQSEQLQSHFYFYAKQGRARGFMLQQLPAQLEKDVENREAHWEEVKALAHTLSEEELLSLDSETIMHRLYHQDEVRLLENKTLQFRCSCSKEKMENALISLGQHELDAILLEQGEIDMQCEFCERGFIFERKDIASLFSDEQVLH